MQQKQQVDTHENFITKKVDYVIIYVNNRFLREKDVTSMNAKILDASMCESKIVVELGYLKSVDNSVLDALLSAYTDFQNRKKTIYLVHAQESLRDIMKQHEISKVPIYDTIDNIPGLR